jgi:hypothetical protein
MLRRAHCTAPKSSGSAAEPPEGRSPGTKKKLRIARRHEDTRSCKGFRRDDQCLEIRVGFSDGMPEKGQCRGVSGNPFVAFDDHGGPALYRVRQLARAVVPMNLPAHTRLQSSSSETRAGRTEHPSICFRSGGPCMTETGSRASKPNRLYRAKDRC